MSHNFSQFSHTTAAISHPCRHLFYPDKNFSGALRFCTNKKACYWGYLYIEYDFLSDFIYQDVYHSAVGVLDLEKLRERFNVGWGSRRAGKQT